jgi:nicotinate-nucleotide adenylyltransferase
MGADLVLDAPKWFAFDRICALAPPLVLGRAGIDGPDLPSAQLPCVSSTEVRAKIAAGNWDAVAHLVPRQVVDHIRARGLFVDARTDTKTET